MTYIDRATANADGHQALVHELALLDELGVSSHALASSRLSRRLSIFLVSETTLPWGPSSCMPASREESPIVTVE